MSLYLIVYMGISILIVPVYKLTGTSIFCVNLLASTDGRCTCVEISNWPKDACDINIKIISIL